MRAYAGANDFEIRTRRAADTAALAQRGFVPVGESFVEARWRTVDWLGALVFLVLIFVVGIFILIYMASNRPGGTLTVTYERQSAGGTGVAAAPTAAEELVRRPAERLRSLRSPARPGPHHRRRMDVASADDPPGDIASRDDRRRRRPARYRWRVFGFLQRDQPGQAAVYFEGTAPPPADAFLRLRDLGYTLTERPADGVLWALHLDHPIVGSAELWCDRDAPPIDEFIRFANNLSDAERSAAMGSVASVGLRVPAKRRNVLRDRKTLLRIAHDVLGDDGVMVLDIASELPWSRASLADELAHDADLDIEALYCLHSVGEDPAESVRWLHSHGLAELGRFDLDILGPHPEFVAACADPIRAIATMILEGEVGADQPRFTFGHPGGDARLVPAADFMRQAEPAMTELRDAEHHDARRSVLCEPAGRKMLGFGRGDTPEPLHLTRRPPPEQFVIYFPTSTTTLMAERALATIDVLRSMTQEFAEFEPVALVKLGYPTEDSKEHLWFTAHSIGHDTIDATLENRPFAVDLQPGERAERPLELISDWVLMTPAGPVTPRSFIAARRMREHADEIRAAMAEARDT